MEGAGEPKPPELPPPPPLLPLELPSPPALSSAFSARSAPMFFL